MNAELKKILISQRAMDCLGIREKEIALSKTSRKEYQMYFLGLASAHGVIKLSESNEFTKMFRQPSVLGRFSIVPKENTIF